MLDFGSIFKTKRPLIGMVHLAPLLGVTDAPEIEKNIENALKDATTLQKAGFDSIIIENNYDLPHDIFVKPNVVSSFTYVANEIAKEISIPIGICVLWNDFYSALSIAKLINASYVRVPVFVDNVKTNYGVVTGDASAVTNFRKQISAENIAIFTDIQVKHSELLNVRPLSESAKEAIKKDSDGLIVTGKWTGDAPKASDLEEVREAADKFPILIGSGADIDNLQTLTKYADGIIIGTAIKEGESLTKEQHVNLKGFDKRISLEKAEKFREKFLRCVSIG
ncbi:hypothetical protein A2415_03065 [candidate division WWE3 bacterium RIFOXYC1_FULL_39_7]|uniref:Photosystem I assembly BtpA n=2 Tax=Katanobacteria TaxID=422282 RepID=A0A1F4X8M7_UNCKA|nr:MAG: hypothetical protein A2415_03065 [candidate division WWE3 bacterium RIFOXYC1_FULL_39_7]OGC78012.1 MAG: hypothetical protein A2619_02920 [candidate division WWE3 bacterium RIFOXYD1_FULL_39_9]